ncbi:hypothetical protein PR048_029503 [Dryococelus australis]|uniref:DDE-1 domain-containing protein n=1 Tax=Dryococelus australis TaxID=614101 RepID=A0ABQ9GGA8_9NEOP|nr:hypothetical protein PR048_029503 [Dryococelus australis]
MTKHKFKPHSIFNIYETGITKVHVPGKVISEKGAKEVSKFLYDVLYQLLVVQCLHFSSSHGFESQRHHDQGAPPGPKVVAYPSGWMTGGNIEIYWDHFIIFVKCAKEMPVLAILDSHDSHTTPAGNQKCKDSGIIRLTIPPHTSHKLQPLDRGVFGPFKHFINQASDDFMANNPEVCPFNSDVFTNDDFLESYATGRPNPTIPNTISADHRSHVITDLPCISPASKTESPLRGCSTGMDLAKQLGLEVVSPEKTGQGSKTRKYSDSNQHASKKTKLKKKKNKNQKKKNQIKYA